MDPSLPKKNQVYDLLRRAIVNLALPPGSTINERAICEQLGISRTPLREAMLQLSAEDLIAVVPNSRTCVTRINLHTVYDGQLVRDALEMKIVRLAANNMTPQFARELDFNLHRQARVAADLQYDEFYDLDEAFHRLICQFGASLFVWRIINIAKVHLDRIRRLAFPEPDHLDVVLREHTAIADALKSGDSKAAQLAMKTHLDRAFDSIRHLTVEHSEYFSGWSAEQVDRYERTLREEGG